MDFLSFYISIGVRIGAHEQRPPPSTASNPCTTRRGGRLRTTGTRPEHPRRGGTGGAPEMSGGHAIEGRADKLSALSRRTATRAGTETPTRRVTHRPRARGSGRDVQRQSRGGHRRPARCLRGHLGRPSWSPPTRTHNAMRASCTVHRTHAPRPRPTTTRRQRHETSGMPPCHHTTQPPHAEHGQAGRPPAERPPERRAPHPPPPRGASPSTPPRGSLGTASNPVRIAATTKGGPLNG